MRHEGLSVDELDNLLNKESGLKALSGVGSDMRDIIDKASSGDEKSRMALQVFTHRLRKYIGAYASIMGGVDAIVFTGGIGENSSVVRHRASQRLEFLGALLDEEKNIDIKLDDSNNVEIFSMPHSRVKLLAIKTNEQLAIARETTSLIKERNKVNTKASIPIAVSARHIHLTKETLETLFGDNYELSQKAPLSQPGQYAANECLTLVGPKNSIENVRILGPCRSKDQIEISRTDEFYLGIDAPVRASGHIENSPGIKLIGPKGSISLSEGVICAWRHIHMHPDDALSFGVKDKDIVDIGINNKDRPLTFGNVLVRVSSNYTLEMHIDTDEANAAELPRFSEGELIATDINASLIQRRTKINKV
jgi:acetate kinase